MSSMLFNFFLRSSAASIADDALDSAGYFFICTLSILKLLPLLENFSTLKFDLPATCLKNPCLPSKISGGPVIPCCAKVAENTAAFVAYPTANPFHIESLPTRICLNGMLDAKALE